MPNIPRADDWDFFEDYSVGTIGSAHAISDHGRDPTKEDFDALLERVEAMRKHFEERSKERTPIGFTFTT